NGLTVRLYDVLTGKDRWKETFAPRSILLRSEAPHFTGAVGTDGSLKVLDARTGKTALQGKLDPKHLDKAETVYLLYDGTYYCTAINGLADATRIPEGLQSNLMPGLGLRSIPVNGQVYGFEAKSSKLRWNQEVSNQSLLLDQVNDLPVLLFTARYNKMLVIG